MMTDFDAEERAALDVITRELHSRGWAKHVTVQRLIDDWRDLTSTADRYGLTVDDYTNDLTGRDALSIVLTLAAEPLRSKLASLVDAADAELRRRTVEDDAKMLAMFFRIEETDGWWWRRVPREGPLARELEEERRRRS